MNAPPPRALVLCLALAGCSPDGAGGPGPAAETCPIEVAPAAPTFVGHVGPALRSSCGSLSTTCHGAPSQGELPKGKIDFSADGGRTAAEVYAELVNVVPANAPAGFFLVAPGDVEHSWLVVKVSESRPGGAGYGERMPLALPFLCAATVDTLAVWIANGAPLE